MVDTHWAFKFGDLLSFNTACAGLFNLLLNFISSVLPRAVPESALYVVRPVN